MNLVISQRQRGPIDQWDDIFISVLYSFVILLPPFLSQSLELKASLQQSF